jgi:hypothetical protein
MDDKKMLVVGGGLAGLSLTYYLRKLTDLDIHLVELSDEFGGFHRYDTMKLDYNYTPKELVTRFITDLKDTNIIMNTLTAGIKKNNILYIYKKSFIRWEDKYIAATGFRCLTPYELMIMGYRPAGVYCLYSVMQMLDDGYIPGHRIVIYGINRFVLALINKLFDTQSIEKIYVIIPYKLSKKNWMEFLDYYGVETIYNNIIWIDGRDRISSVKLSDNIKIECDTLILGFVTEYNVLNSFNRVGNSAIIVDIPDKIIELSKLYAENFIEIQQGSETSKIVGNAKVWPVIISREIRKVMVGYYKGSILDINGKKIVINEDYEIIDLPDDTTIFIRVLKEVR